MKQKKLTTRSAPKNRDRGKLEQLMALANEIARYASTSNEGHFERALMVTVSRNTPNADHCARRDKSTPTRRRRFLFTND